MKYHPVISQKTIRKEHSFQFKTELENMTGKSWAEVIRDTRPEKDSLTGDFHRYFGEYRLTLHIRKRTFKLYKDISADR